MECPTTWGVPDSFITLGLKYHLKAQKATTLLNGWWPRKKNNFYALLLNACFLGPWLANMVSSRCSSVPNSYQSKASWPMARDESCTSELGGPIVWLWYEAVSYVPPIVRESSLHVESHSRSDSSSILATSGCSQAIHATASVVSIESVAA